MRVLVTGHNGYIGSVARAAARRRAATRSSASTRTCSPAARSGPSPSGRPSIALRHPRRAAPRLLDGFDAVVHLAGISNDPLGDLNPDCTYDINHRGTIALAQAAKAAGVERFVFSSSCSLYGAARRRAHRRDAPTFHPVTPYGESKVLAERDLTTLADDTSARLPAQRHGLRRVGAAARRPGREQPRGLRLRHRRGLHEERRHAVAAPRAHRGHRPGHRRRRRGAPRAGPRPGVQRRPHRGELPHPRGGRRSSATWSRTARSPSPTAPAPTCATTGSTATSSPRRPRLRAHAGRCAPASSSSTPPTVPLRPHLGRPRRGRSCQRHRATSSACLDERRPRPVPALDPGRHPRSTTSTKAHVVPDADHRPVPVVRRGRACATFLDLGEDAAGRRPGAGRARSTSPTSRFPLDVAFCPDCCAGADPRGGAAREAVRRQLPLLLVVLRPPAAPLAASTRSGLIERQGLGPDSLVVELASNDGYLLQATSSSRHPGARASTRRPTRPPPPTPPACPPSRSSSASTWPSSSAAEGRPGRRDHRQQRDGPRARPQRLRRRAWRTLLKPTTASSPSRTRTSAT